MRKIILSHETAVLFTCLVLSRVLVSLSGVTFQYNALFTYWQYLDVESMKHRLLRSVWYMHAQPPVFNLFAGGMLQMSGMYAAPVFQAVWIAVSFVNACLVLRILKSLLPESFLPLVIAGFYLLSPATILYENELFYTSFTSMLLLLAIFFLNRFVQLKIRFSLTGFFIAVSMLCLTRSIYHLFWLIGICAILLFVNYKKPYFRKVLFGSVLSILVVSAWYIKNYIIFGIFSLSSWTGINLSRIVFHDVAVRDSSGIAAVHPFYPVSYYIRYIPADYRKKYAGMDDYVLLREMKNDSAINMNHAAYIPISEKYMEASLLFIRQHPAIYLKHVLTSSIIFFSPASAYFQVETNNRKIALYDLVYSFNLSYFFGAKEDKRIALAVSAVPKCLLYLLVLLYTGRRLVSGRHLSVINACIMFTILFVFITTTLFEYGENMRFRYELEPLFLVLLARLIAGKINIEK